MVAVDEDVFQQAIEGLVIVKFIAAIEGFGGVGEDFDDQLCKSLIGWRFLILAIAGNEQIGIIKAISFFESGFDIGKVNETV